MEIEKAIEEVKKIADNNESKIKFIVDEEYWKGFRHAIYEIEIRVKKKV